VCGADATLRRAARHAFAAMLPPFSFRLSGCRCGGGARPLILPSERRVQQMGAAA